jgi:hypothetical protein
MTRDNGAGLRQPEFPVAGMARRRVKALDAACSQLLLAREAKKEAAVLEKQAARDIQSELDARELDSYVFQGGEQRFVATSVRKDQIKLVEIHAKARKRSSDDEPEGEP